MSVFRRKREDNASPGEEPVSAAVPVTRDPDLTVPPYRPPTAPAPNATPKDTPTMNLPSRNGPQPASTTSATQFGRPGGASQGGPSPVAGIAQPPRPQANPSERRTLIVGKGISLQGTVADAERLEVEGTVESKMIHAQELLIAHSGVFKGEVEVEDAEVAGVFDGTVTARGNLIIRATGRVLGVARCRRLQVEEGGQLSGRMEMLTDAPNTVTSFPPHPDRDAAEA